LVFPLLREQTCKGQGGDAGGEQAGAPLHGVTRLVLPSPK
jgi:hypothetical protein